MKRVCLRTLLLFLVVGCADSAQRTEAAGGCPFSFKQGTLSAKMDWTSGPSSEKVSAFNLKFLHLEEGMAPVAVDGEITDVKAFARMTCCGTIAPAEVTRLGGGEYAVEGLRLMAGEWDVTVNAMCGDGVETQVQRLQVE